ncbi:MAG TPA: DUF6159 family protein [Bryobacteraceae bacterium]|nr:DUF6159 family protein [Bryobacteraceae bacterium]
MNTLSRTWQLFKQSFAVLSQEPSLVVFPILSAASALFLMAGFLVPLYRLGSLQAIVHRTAGWDDYLPVFSWYYANTFVVIFFNSALAGCVNMRLCGADPTLGDGLSIAARRLPRIAAWTLMSATFGLVLRAIENHERAGRFVTAIFGAGWTMITYLMVPVLIIEDRPVIESFRRSIELLRKSWGEQIAGGFGFGLLGSLLVIPGFLLGLVLLPVSVILGITVIVTCVLMLAAIFGAIRGIFTVALYRYATDGRAPLGFSGDALGSPRPYSGY